MTTSMMMLIFTGYPWRGSTIPPLSRYSATGKDAAVGFVVGHVPELHRLTVALFDDAALVHGIQAPARTLLSAPWFAVFLILTG